MLRILLTLISAGFLGLGLAQLAGRLPISAGALGFATLLVAALAVRRRWGLLAEAAPGTPERQLWVALGGNALVGSHLLATLVEIGPSLQLHTPRVHALGIDSWTLVAGAVAAYLIAREPEPRSDERDRWIAERGLRAGHYALVLVVLGMILSLGFVRGGWIGALSHPSIAHGLILALIISVLSDAIARLRIYALEASAEAESGE